VLKKQPPANGHGEISSISFEAFFSLHDSDRILLFDARPAYFFNLGHIPKATHLSADDCDPIIQSKEAEIKAALAAGKTIVVYCTGFGCKDARTLSRHLSSFGYPVSVFSGGWRAWTSAELPTESSPTPLTNQL
jgi:rhodanese-related sulfurtransferase